MTYQTFQDLKISSLGMGNMRLPVDENGIIQKQKAEEMLVYAYENGINYFDTAYRYHDGQSEPFVGEVLAQFPRETWYLASKMPGHMMHYKNGKLGFQGYLAGHTMDSIAELFEDQLARCGVDYFDFYLLHNVAESSYDFYTNEELGVVRYLQEQKKQGKIRHLGFSSHGRVEIIERFLDHYPGIFEFVQIQLNYMDWALQEAGRKYELLTKRNIPVVVMEPVRGGALASLSEAGNALLKEKRPQDSIAAWAFRYLQALPGLLTVLSGMTTMEQLKENMALFANPDPVTPEKRRCCKKQLQIY
ncbi:MAG: aldo/keto reductase [Christensenellaceae bacterium]|jgi:predicted aldo/keto reductase-like oxidoreductase